LIVAGEGATAQTNTFPSSGNAGIGTPTPSVKLEVISSVTTGTATARFKNTGANTQVVLDADASQNTNLRFDANAAPAWYFGNDASNSRFRLLNSNANGNVEVFSILQGGNVGIGTSNPAKKLHVFGTNSQVLIDRTANTAGNYALVNFATAGVQKFFFGLNADAGAGVDKLSVFDSVFSASTPVMTFTGGNVGLGTTSPLQKLQIGTNTTTATRRLIRFRSARHTATRQRSMRTSGYSTTTLEMSMDWAYPSGSLISLFQVRVGMYGVSVVVKKCDWTTTVPSASVPQRQTQSSTTITY
jgi:hypothetical protein